MANNVTRLPNRNSTRYDTLLTEPASDITLEELKVELNEIVTLRLKSMAQFCRRLARVYMLIVNRPMSQSEPKDKKKEEYYTWVRLNVKKANGKPYANSTISSYTHYGFSPDAENLIKHYMGMSSSRARVMRRVGVGMAKAMHFDGTCALPINQIKDKYKVVHPVAQQTNHLMVAWDEASLGARALFLKALTGQKVR